MTNNNNKAIPTSPEANPYVSTLKEMSSRAGMEGKELKGNNLIVDWIWVFELWDTGVGGGLGLREGGVAFKL